MDYTSLTQFTVSSMPHNTPDELVHLFGYPSGRYDRLWEYTGRAPVDYDLDKLKTLVITQYPLARLAFDPVPDRDVYHRLWAICGATGSATYRLIETGHL